MLEDETHFGNEIILPCAMFLLTPGSSGASPAFTGAVSPFAPMPVGFSSACGAIVDRYGTLPSFGMSGIRWLSNYMSPLELKMSCGHHNGQRRSILKISVCPALGKRFPTALGPWANSPRARAERKKGSHRHTHTTSVRSASPLLHKASWICTNMFMNSGVSLVYWLSFPAGSYLIGQGVRPSV